ncbi:hypothetical protein EH240_30110 [Mesorhizobium tamadayense]|uniref:YscD/Y4YQ C-terminal domain-containing protein n=1 Tax=Mesorhizobium tamadayense TaxID=425306 RepID=A0A3P3F4R1_9HYPH|nr:hypothetical protein [Mesorhizobium tamadayense]RRH93216.1 hypothetical protein EH240_30110 [Mesorhizobium tamadayense]
MDNSVSLHFEVLSGLYSGLTGKAALETSLIGGGLDADIIFVEQGLAPHHLRITLLGNSIEIEALAIGVSMEGSRNIAAGECVVVPLPVVIHAGAMSIRWSAQYAAPAGSIGIPRLSISVLALVLLGSLGIGALSAIFSYYGNAGALSANSPSAELESKPTNKRADDQTAVAAAKDLQEEVDKAGLLDIKIGSAKGVVTAEGTVTSASVIGWQKAQQWFDHRTNGALTLVNGVVIKEEKAPSAIAVEAVWRGSPPYLVIDGEKYFVGALLDDGWMVDRIEDGRVLLSRNGRLAALPY